RASTGCRVTPTSSSRSNPPHHFSLKGNNVTEKKIVLRKPAVVRVASIPDAEVAKRYIGRTIDGLMDFEIFTYAFENALNVLIEGPTGPGKTMASRAFAASNGMCFYAIPSNVGVEPSQLFGKYIPNEDALDESDPKFIWQDGPVTDI